MSQWVAGWEANWVEVQDSLLLLHTPVPVIQGRPPLAKRIIALSTVGVELTIAVGLLHSDYSRL